MEKCNQGDHEIHLALHCCDGIRANFGKSSVGKDNLVDINFSVNLESIVKLIVWHLNSETCLWVVIVSSVVTKFVVGLLLDVEAMSPNRLS